MINTPSYAERFSGGLFVGAAAVKMMGVLTAMRFVGLQARLVTLPVPNVSTGDYFVRAAVDSTNGFPARYLLTSRCRWIRKMLGLVGFALFAWRGVRKRDQVIIYNHALEYVLALLVLRFRDISVYHDIEDAPLERGNWCKRFVRSFPYRVAETLTDDKKIVASSSIANALEFREFITIYGVHKPYRQPEWCIQKWRDLAAGGPLRIHYGGTIQISTGVGLLVETLDQLAQHLHLLPRRLVIIVTGAGDLHLLKSLQTTFDQDQIHIECHESVSHDFYLELLRSCHVSLALKLSDSELGSTTFPSKVIEIASNEVAVCATCVSDIPILFDETSAYLVREESPDFFAGLLVNIASDPDGIRQRSIEGFRVIERQCSNEVIGTLIQGFLISERSD